MLHHILVRRHRGTAVVCFTTLLIAGSSAFLAHARPASAAKPNVVTVVATDYAFQAPDTLPAGRTAFRLVNRGPDLHHVWLVRLPNGKSVADVATAMQQPGSLPAWVVEVGGPNTPMPGGESNATLTLEPGRYAMMCAIPAPDGQRHFMKGMMKEITVVPATAAQLASMRAGDAEPRPNVVMTLSDYDFVVSTPITAGRRTIRIRNAAAQTHEVLLARLAPGATAQQFLAFIEKPSGPPPGEAVGGITGLTQGRENDITVAFTKGDYALICFVPDAKDGKPHVAHGMIKQFRVE